MTSVMRSPGERLPSDRRGFISVTSLLPPIILSRCWQDINIITSATIGIYNIIGKSRGRGLRRRSDHPISGLRGGRSS